MRASISIMLLSAIATAQGPPPPSGGGGGGGGGMPSPPEGASKCKVDGSSASATIDTTSNANFVVVSSNGCPNHHHINGVGNNPNDAYEQTISLNLPKQPTLRATLDNTNIDTALGVLGISASNTALYGPAVGPDGGDAGITEVDSFDCGQGHSSPDGMYHYHIAPYLTLTAGSPPAASHSALVGFLVDGLPVYGPNGDNGAPPTNLDACGGHSGDGGGLGYHYHTRVSADGVRPGPGDEATTNNTKPYFASCFRGCIPDGERGAQSESYADCVAAGSPAPAGTGYASTFALLQRASYNYSGCPASFFTELAKELEEENGANSGYHAAASMSVVLLAAIAAVFH